MGSATEAAARGCRERPIIFGAESVRAILAGQKTQTRRAVLVPWTRYTKTTPYEPYYVESDGRLLVMDDGGDYHPMESCCPYGTTGDRLWVRETLRRFGGGTAQYAADLTPVNGREARQPCDPAGRAAWAWPGRSVVSPIFMPRWASRVMLEVTGVRVERLQGMNRGDAMAEGCPFPNMADGPSPLGWFSAGWDSLNAKRGFTWDSNPWVWVIEFRPVTP